jgi:hypothetical protein
MPPKAKASKKEEDAPKPTGLTIDDLAKLLNANKPAEKPKRKPVERSAQQKEAMLERLAIMRAKANENRKEKAKYINKELEEINTIETGTSLEVKKMNEKNTDDLFEKKYNSRFEKIDETMGEIKSHLTEMREAKKAKAEAKAKQLLEKQESKEQEKQNEEVVHQSKPQVNQFNNSQPSIPTPLPSNPNKIAKVPNYKTLFKKYY